MRILALEFSSSVRSVAVLAGRRSGHASERGRREMKAFALIDAALKQAEVGRDEIDCIAVGLGPGSYAGVRTAIAMARGWQMARRIQVLGISSADAVAAEAGRSGHAVVMVALDGQRGDLFAACYDTTSPDDPRLIEPFRSRTAAECAGGKGNAKLYWMDCMMPDAPSGTVSPPDAGVIARLAARRAEAASLSHLEPIYLRAAEFVKAAGFPAAPRRDS